MSELSVNEHLEGILSDFEALKRSFEIEDVDDIPSSSTSPISTPVSPSSSTFFLQHNKAFDGHGGDGQTPSLAFNNNNNGVSSAAHHSCINLGSSPSPVLKSRAVVSSLSFNRGTMNKPGVHHNGSSVTRALSFQSRVNPSSYYLLSGPNSDNESLHSSTSSLEYSGNTGGAPPLNRFGSYPSPPPQREYQAPVQLPPQQLGGDANLIINHSLKKFSSHGSVFHNEMNQRSGVMMDAERPRGLNHGSMPSLDLQNRDGRGIVGVQRGEGRGSPGLRYANANAYWNGGLNNHNSFGMEQGHQQQGLKVLKAPQPKVKETLRLNKFPLDLESLVSSTGAESPAMGHGGSAKPNPPVPYPRSTGVGQHINSPPPTLISPSASLSSLDGQTSDTQTLILHNPTFPSSPSSLSSTPVPLLDGSPVHLPLSRSPQMGVLAGPQIAQAVPGVPRLLGPSSPPVVQRGAGDAGDSVGSILERIASFSRPVLTDGTDAVAVIQSSPVQNHCRSAAGGGSALGSRNQLKMNHKEPCGELESELLAPMEEAEEKDRGMMGVERGGEVQCDGDRQPDSKNVQNCVLGKEENGVDICLSVKEKGMEEEEEVKKELEVELEVQMELEADACQRFPAQQVGFIRGNDLFGYVGIEAVLDQMRRKTMKSAFEFNIMVVGQSGLGKSTLVNTLFKSKVSRKSCLPSHTEEISKTVKLHSISHVIEEKGVKMKLTVVDTPGFGDQINNDNCWEPIVTYVKDQYEKYLREELHVNRKRRIPDTRVHCCIYFLPATGHRLRPIDVEFMKRLGKIVSIVPVIAKADTLTIEERQEFKERIRQDLAANGIQVYPQKEYDEDPEEHVINDRIRESIPFAVVGTDKEHHVNGNKVLGRKTKWGIIEVENVAHCEFSNLRDLLIRTHLQDLKDVTHNIHYETYRVRRLNESNITFSELGLLTRPLENGTADKCDPDSHL